MKKFIIWMVVIIVIGFGYYAISPLFRVVEVNDPLPTMLEQKTEDIDTEEDITNMSNDIENLPSEEIDVVDKMTNDESVGESQDVDDTSTEPNKEITTDTEVKEKVSTVTGTTGHPASGSVRVIDTQDGQVIRYEDFSTINGPNLHIYLSKDLDAEEFVDLGPIKGTKGNINYTVPGDIDLNEYKYTLYWCVPFGVLFNYAEIN